MIEDAIDHQTDTFKIFHVIMDTFLPEIPQEFGSASEIRN